MRTFVLALAILLLPLRGWLGDAMALETVHATGAAAAAPMQHGMRGMPDMHAMQGADDADGMSEAEETAATEAPGSHPANATHDCQSTCTDCQLCHSIAIAVWPEVPTPDAATRALPALLSVAFASAEPAPGFKPPIS